MMQIATLDVRVGPTRVISRCWSTATPWTSCRRPGCPLTCLRSTHA